MKDSPKTGARWPISICFSGFSSSRTDLLPEAVHPSSNLSGSIPAVSGPGLPWRFPYADVRLSRRRSGPVEPFEGWRLGDTSSSNVGVAFPSSGRCREGVWRFFNQAQPFAACRRIAKRISRPARNRLGPSSSSGHITSGRQCSWWESEQIGSRPRPGRRRATRQIVR